MREITGDIWDYHDTGHWIVITTNGNIRANREAVMGKGLALQAKQRYPRLPLQLGKALRQHGNHVHRFLCFYDEPLLEQVKIITFPTKHDWWEKSDLALIERSCSELVETASMFLQRGEEVYMTRPGCRNGQLDWENEVKPILERCLDGRFTVVEREER